MITLQEGQTIFVQGSGKKPYEIKMVGGVVSCSCPAWRNQSLSIDQRTCKHIKANVSNGAQPSVQSGSVVNGTGTQTKPAKINKNVPPCLLAHTWDGEQDVSGWLLTEKLDGVRAWWDGQTFWSRLGNEYHAPQWFKDKMPKNIELDGELFAGNGKFPETVSTVKKLIPNDDEWKQIKFMIFDAPKHSGAYEERIDFLLNGPTMLCPGPEDSEWFCQVLQPWPIANNKEVFKRLKEYESLGYEGIMLRQPGSLYEEGRSNTLLKVKSFKDCEVTVVGYENGKGKHKGRMGALNVRMDSGVEFNVGSGFTDKDRENPPAIGSKVTVKFQELSRDGIPRFPVYITERSYE